MKLLPVQLDDTDIALLKSLMKDGRMSFRDISREINVSTPTVKPRYERLVNIGLVKSIRPEIDISKVDRKSKNEFGGMSDVIRSQKNHSHIHVEDLSVKLKCQFCGGPIHDKAKVLKFAHFERFFCCIQCRASYKEKHSGRIQMLKEQFGKR